MDRTTYILGAGFSRYANLPLMNDFYFRSKDLYPKLTDEPDKRSFEKVFEYFDDFSKVKHIMDADFYNIEELLSIIEMDSFVNGSKSIHKDYLNYLKKVIELSSPTKENDEGNYIIEGNITTKIYTDFLLNVYGIDKKLGYGRSQEPYEYYFRSQVNDNGIISLNYDLILEKGLKSLNDHNEQNIFNYNAFDFEYRIENKYVRHMYAQETKNKLKLAKIHGSINFSNKSVPIIVPPTWNKTSNKQMQSIWKFAHDMLSQSNIIVFIGYSLPETDLYVKYLLISGIKDCYNLKEIIAVCYDEKNEVKNRYEKFFDINFRNKAFKFYPIKFEKWFSELK